MKETADEVTQELARQVDEAEKTFVSQKARSSDGEIAGQAFELAQAIERAEANGAGEDDLAMARAELKSLVDVWGKAIGVSGSDLVADLAPFVELLIDLRAKLRAAKQYALADELRDRLASLGIVLEDTPAGTTWRKS